MKEVDEAVNKFLAGRIWHREHIPFPIEQIDRLISEKQITLMRGITTKKAVFGIKHFCNRCHNDNQSLFTHFDCAKCKGPCTYCRNCLKMARVSNCTELAIWSGEALQFPTEHRLDWHSELTNLQQQASDELIASHKQKKSHLISAVCGAGKTEIIFEPIAYCLKRGERICLAAPRVDVILELEPRLRAAFPETTIDVLYGGQKPSLEPTQLILATTHQLYRFHEAFDALFIDEADAFPYTADVTLQRAVQKAAKPNAPIHFITATPSQKLLQDANKRKALSELPRRYHGHPLPMPTFTALWRYQQQINKGKLPKVLRQWIEKCLQNKQPFLLFFHHIQLMNEALPLIQALDPKVEAVHAAHPDRKQFVVELRNKERPGLLTTTILERGITIRNVQVAVIGAEQSIFTKSALIQIGGRVGRSKDAPAGDFILFHHGISYAMDDAKKEIAKLNVKGGF